MSARSPASAARTAPQIGRGAPNPDQLRRYVENHSFWRHHLPAEQLYYKHSNRAYLQGAKAMGLIDDDGKITLQLYSETLQKFRLAARRSWRGRSRRSGCASGSRGSWTRCRSGTRRSKRRWSTAKRFPLHAITQRPMAMYHSWGSQNAWLRQILSENRLYMHRETAAALWDRG